MEPRPVRPQRRCSSVHLAFFWASLSFSPAALVPATLSVAQEKSTLRAQWPHAASSVESLLLSFFHAVAGSVQTTDDSLEVTTVQARRSSPCAKPKAFRRIKSAPEEAGDAESLSGRRTWVQTASTFHGCQKKRPEAPQSTGRSMVSSATGPWGRRRKENLPRPSSSKSG